MSLPDEQVRSVRSAKQFLEKVAYQQKTKIPKVFRQEAHNILHHWPFDFLLNEWEKWLTQNHAKNLRRVIKRS